MIKMVNFKARERNAERRDIFKILRANAKHNYSRYSEDKIERLLKEYLDSVDSQVKLAEGPTQKDSASVRFRNAAEYMMRIAGGFIYQDRIDVAQDCYDHASELFLKASKCCNHTPGSIEVLIFDSNKAHTNAMACAYESKRKSCLSYLNPFKR